MTPRALLGEIRRRALLAYIVSGGKLSHDEAEALAAKEVIAEQRAKPRVAPRGAANPARDNVTVANARSFLINYLSALSERMRSPITPRDGSNATPKPRRVLITPRPKITEQPVEPSPPEPTPAPTLLFTGRATAAELIGDNEYHTSVLDLTTSNWRRSLIENERRALEHQRRRLTTWVG